MIFGVWIIHKDGKCLLFREYAELNIDEQLFSGFLVAILAFSKEISNRQLKSLNLEDLTLYYKHNQSNKLIFVIAADSKERESRVREKIDRIEERFILKFGEILPEWSGDISIFSDFEPELDSILNTKGIQFHTFDLNFLSISSFENLVEKFSQLLGTKQKKEIDKKEAERLIKTFGIIQNLHLIMDVPQKIKSALQYLIKKKEEKKE
ncbi:MAG: hypothetical protein LUQ65_07655 [Candidatus Helarchaeota archaeon]|nr:hypothetical protein [Candidatus Helarchaeota archaeon]